VTVVVEGLRETRRAFRMTGSEIDGELRDGLRRVAEPVRGDAERLARARIKRIGTRWSRMRTKVLSAGVYVAPNERGRHSRRNPNLRRPKFGTRLMDDAMQPALVANADRIERTVEHELDDLWRRWERV